MSTRTGRWLLAAALLVPLTAAGCTPARTCTGALSGSVSYVSGSVPPPYHVEWTVTLDGGQGRLEVTPGYGAVQRWTGDFAVDPARATAACTALAGAEEVDEVPPGSAVMAAELTDAEGATLRRRTTVSAGDAQYEAVRGTVPSATWDTVYGAYDRWSRDQ